MPKVRIEPSPYLLPVPAVLVTSRDAAGKANVIAVSWIGVACSDPPMLSLGIRPSRHSHDIIESTGELVVNVPRADRVAVVDRVGSVSGRRVDKLAEFGLATEPAAVVKPPLLADCPLCLECKVRHVLRLGAHDLFVVEVVATHVDREALDESGGLRLDVLNPLGYCATDNSYVSLAAVLGTYGYTQGDDVER